MPVPLCRFYYYDPSLIKWWC